MSAAAMLSPDTPLSEPSPGTTSRLQRLPAVAASSSMFLLVWVDQDSLTSPATRLLGFRVDGNGLPIDSEPFVISDRPVPQDGLAVASDGTNFLVAWARPGSGDSLLPMTTLVRSNGSVSVMNGVTLNASATRDSPKLIGGAEGFLLLWNEYGSNRVRGARISSGGDVVDPSGVPMDPLPPFNPFQPSALGSDGSNYIYVAQQYQPATSNYATFRWRIAQANASVSGPAQIFDTNFHCHYYSLAFNGSRFLLTAQVHRLDYLTNMSVFLNPEGVFLAPGPALPGRAPDLDGTRNDYEVTMSASANGQFLLLMSTRYPGYLKALRFSGTGDLISSNELAIPTEYSDGGFAAGSQAYLLFHQDPVASYAIVASVLSTNGSLLRQFSPQGPDQQFTASVATDGADYLVVWYEPRNGSNFVYAARVSASGAVAIPGPLRVVEATSGFGAPRVAYSAGVYLIVWQDYFAPAIRARRLNRAGVWLDAAPWLVASNANNPSVAASGTNFLVVWDTGSYYLNVFGTLVTTNGSLSTNGPYRFSTAGDDWRFPRLQMRPATAFDGWNYVVAWANHYAPGGAYFKSWRLISPGGEFYPGYFSTEQSYYSDGTTPLLARHRNTVLLTWNTWNSDTTTRIATIDEGYPTATVPLGIWGTSLASHAGAIWAAGMPEYNVSHVAFTALDTQLKVTVPPFYLAEDSSSPALASNGTNLLCAYLSLSPSSVSSGRRPRMRLRLIYPDTTLRVTREAGLRLTGRAVHSFVIDRSPDLENWTPFRTNTAPGPFEIPVSSGSAEFFRMQWYP